MSGRKIKRALISVYDKTGIVDFARALVDEFGIEIISTGGTAKLLKENGIPVTLVEDVTGFPEMLDGRVKTLHPKIHAAILADRDNPEHMRQLAEQGIEPIDMVVVNLYPFEETVKRPDCTLEEAIEMIDIGGVCLLRAAAKNHKSVLPVPGPVFYGRTLKYLRDDPRVVECDWKQLLVTRTFQFAASYDIEVHSYFATRYWTGSPLRPVLFLDLVSAVPNLSGELRYGENPHQRGTVYSVESARDTITLHGAKYVHEHNIDASLNNYVDASAATELCAELTREMGRAKILFARREPDVAAEAQSRFGPISDDVLTRRNLPHWQIPGATYFITFRSSIGELAPEERDIVLGALRHWDGTRLQLHAAVVMRDHVHALLTPGVVGEQPGEYQNLSGLLQSIKAFSGREISKRRGGVGAVWVHESFDRWIRSESDFQEKWAYIANNPVKEGLASTPEEYRWWYGVEETPEPGRWGNGEARNPPCSVHTDSDPASKEDLCSPAAKTTGLWSPAASKAELCSPLVCVFIKHTNACGTGVSDDPVEAYRRAYVGDPNAAMGGILACNFEVKPDLAQAVMESYDRWGKGAGAGGFFVEVWIAPEFDDGALEVIKKAKKWGERVRLLAVGDMTAPPDENALEYRSIAGGMLVQTRDLVGLNEDQWKVVTKRAPSESEISDLRLAWLVAKHTKSNAISVCKDGMLIGNGAGQMSRVMSCRIATWLAKENGHEEKLKGSAAASDAFFPFADGPNILIDAGVTAIIQPGGSKRDEEAIAACNDRGVAMIFTGTRHFRH